MLMKRTTGEKIFGVFNYGFLFLLMAVTVYPFLFTLFASLSEPGEVIASGGILLWPKGFNAGAYKLVIQDQSVMTGFVNTLTYVTGGTIINVMLTILAAYALSRKWLYGRNFIMFLITFTMFFSGGLIPTYLIVKGLGLLDTRLAMVIPNAISAFMIIIMRTYILSIPDSMEESAKMDGANDFKVLFRIILPLCLPVVAVIVLFYAVAHWNSWFNALVFLQDRSLYPLQMFLREILVQAEMQQVADLVTEPIAENIKYASVIVSTAPILFLYPFLQRYFVHGIMVGAIKE